MTLDELIEAEAQAAANHVRASRRVDVALRVLAEAAEAAPYIAREEGPLPDGVSARTAREAAPKIPGATKPGRHWVIPRAAWEAYASERTPAPKRKKESAREEYLRVVAGGSR